MKKFIFPIIATALVIGCKSDDQNPITKTDNYSEGYFVVNEGNFTHNNAEISYLKSDLSSIENQLFKKVNNKILGDVAQCLTQNDKYVFLVINNSNTVEIVDKKNFKSIATISKNLQLPRYATVTANKIWVTNSNKTISTYNLSNFSFSDSISLEYTPEYIESTNNTVYVTTGPWTSSGRMNAFDSTPNTNSSYFDRAITGITKNNNTVYLLTSDEYMGAIFKMEGTSPTKIATILRKSLFLRYYNNKLYYTSGNTIFEYDLNSKVSISLFSVRDTGFSAIYGFDVFDEKIFIANAKAFNETGEIDVYNMKGQLLKSIKVGMGPNAVHKIQ